MCQKIWAGVSPSLRIPKLTQYAVCEKWTNNLGRAPPPSFGQNPKEQLLFFVKPFHKRDILLFLYWLIVKRTVFFCLFVRIGREGWWLVSLFLLVSLYWIGVHFVLLLCLLRGLVRMTVGWYLFYCLLAHTGRAYIFLFDSFVCSWRLAGRAGGCYLSFCLFVWIYRLCGYYIFIFLFVCGDWYLCYCLFIC